MQPQFFCVIQEVKNSVAVGSSALRRIYFQPQPGLQGIIQFS